MERQNRMPGMLVIFGGTGDLTHRKLMPALYNLCMDGLLPERFTVVAVGRRDKTYEQYLGEVYKSLEQYSRNRITSACWERLKSAVRYYRMDLEDLSGYKQLASWLNELHPKGAADRIYYLAVAPEYFETIVAGLKAGHMAESGGRHSKLVIEKPFGRDLITAQKLNSRLLEVFPEENIYRIDHYLGKEMIQNIMVLRFCNLVFNRCGAAGISTTSRYRCANSRAWARGADITSSRARCATWCRTMRFRCFRWWRWSRPPA